MRITLGMGVGAGGGAAPWTPAKLGSALLVWLRADLGITLNGAKVSAWADQSGNGRNATQGTAANQPTYVSSEAALNGQASVLFSSADATRLVTSTFSVVAQPFTVFCVARAAAQASFGHIHDSVNGGDRVLCGIEPTTPRRARSFAGALLVEPTPPGWSTGASRVFVCTYNGANSAIYINSLTAAATGNAGTLRLGALSVGGGSAGTDPFNGDVPEIFAVSDTDSTTRTLAMRYLANRYGITLT